MQITTDRYGGVTIDNTTLPETNEQFKKELSEIIESANGKKLLWIKLPIENSSFIPILTNLDFNFHHCDEKELMLVKKLIENPVVPTAKNYTLGVGAIVRDGDKILVIKEALGRGYKLPGGHIDDNEKIKDALKREVHEETGIEIEFESIVNIGHFTQGQFGESNLYVVCTAKALSKEIHIYDTSEIVDAQWMKIDEYLALEETNNYNRSVVEAAVNGGVKLQNRDLKLNFPGEVFF